ncbi:Carbon monoxide dehydrogenase [Bordetella sputigena]|uniref:SRPBCC family protein n=1 Tax=Bordetella sputigena TaxID=1416810 RepID=UPI0039EFEFD6
MQFTNNFEVSLPPDQAWPVLMDIESIVPCMPGAELVEIVDDKSFKGKVAVKLGPVALSFLCNAVFEEVDNTAHTARIKASGADAKGRGNANTTIRFGLQPSAKGSKVIIDTDLTLSGAVAQYGRGVGMIQTVANQIISQFSKNLEAQISHGRQAGESIGSAASAGNVGAGVDAGAAAGAGTGATPAPAAGATNGMAGAAGATGGQAPTGPRTPRPPVQPAKPISGFSLILSSLWAMIRGWFGGSSR